MAGGQQAGGARRRNRAAIGVVAVGVLLLFAACSGDDRASSKDGEVLGPRLDSAATGSGSEPSGQGPTLKAPGGTDSATLENVAEIVRTRLTRMGVTDATVTTDPDGIDISSSADAYQLHAAAQHRATIIAPITTTALGPCNGPGNPSTPPIIRCYVLGPTLTGVSPVTNAAVPNNSGVGWRVTFSIAPSQYQSFRAALASSGTAPLALVADGVVVLAFGSGVPALQSALGPPLAEDQARQAAAALAVDSDLPVALEPPALPASPGARVGLDFWTAALGVKICGTWLDNGPASGLDTGVHSHGDGLVYVHPYTADEAGDNATLGLFLQRGGWHASTDLLKVWDGDEHHSGDRCPDGKPAQVRWWVDGVEQHTDPTAFTPRNGQVIVLSFDSDPTLPGTPPQMASLYVPRLGAAT